MHREGLPVPAPPVAQRCARCALSALLRLWQAAASWRRQRGSVWRAGSPIPKCAAGVSLHACSAKSAVRVVKQTKLASEADCSVGHSTPLVRILGQATASVTPLPAALFLHSKQQKQLAQQVRQDVWRTVT